MSREGRRLIAGAVPVVSAVVTFVLACCIWYNNRCCVCYFWSSCRAAVFLQKCCSMYVPKGIAAHTAARVLSSYCRWWCLGKGGRCSFTLMNLQRRQSRASLFCLPSDNVQRESRK